MLTILLPPFPRIIRPSYSPAVCLSVRLSLSAFNRNRRLSRALRRHCRDAEHKGVGTYGDTGTRAIIPPSFDRISIFEFNLSLRSNDVQNFWTLSPPNFETFRRACHGKAEFHQLLGDTWARI